MLLLLPIVQLLVEDIKALSCPWSEEAGVGWHVEKRSESVSQRFAHHHEVAGIAVHDEARPEIERERAMVCLRR
jgi:hypothetical protein